MPCDGAFRHNDDPVRGPTPGEESLDAGVDLLADVGAGVGCCRAVQSFWVSPCGSVLVSGCAIGLAGFLAILAQAAAGLSVELDLDRAGVPGGDPDRRGACDAGPPAVREERGSVGE